MEKRILELKALFQSGVDRELFFKLILHSTDGNPGYTVQYQNDKTIAEWVELYNRKDVNFGVSKEQIHLFYEYMSTYYDNFFGKHQGKYFISINLTNEQKLENNFYFESILLTALRLF